MNDELEQQLVVLKTLKAKISFVAQYFHLPDHRMISNDDMNRIQVGQGLFFLLRKNVAKPNRYISRKYTRHQLHLIVNYLLCVDKGLVLPFGGVVNSRYYATVLINQFPHVYKLVYKRQRNDDFVESKPYTPSLARGRLYTAGAVDQQDIQHRQVEQNSLLTNFERNVAKIRFLNISPKTDREMSQMCGMFRNVYQSFLNSFQILQDRRERSVESLIQRNRGAYRRYMKFITKVAQQRQESFHARLDDRLFLDRTSMPVQQLTYHMDDYNDYVPAILQQHEQIYTNWEIFAFFDKSTRNKANQTLIRQFDKNSQQYSIFSTMNMPNGVVPEQMCKFYLWFAFNSDEDAREFSFDQIISAQIGTCQEAFELINGKAVGSWSPERKDLAQLLQKIALKALGDSKFDVQLLSLQIILELAFTRKLITNILDKLAQTNENIKVLMCNIVQQLIQDDYHPSHYRLLRLVDQVLTNGLWEQCHIVRIGFFISLNFNKGKMLFSYESEQTLIVKIMKILCAAKARDFYRTFISTYRKMQPYVFLSFYSNLAKLASNYRQTGFENACLEFYKEIGKKRQVLEKWARRIGDAATTCGAFYWLTGIDQFYHNLKKNGVLNAVFVKFVLISEDIIRTYRKQQLMHNLSQMDIPDLCRTHLAWQFVQMVVSHKFWCSYAVKFVGFYEQNKNPESIVKIVIGAVLQAALQSSTGPTDNTKVTQEAVNEAVKNSDIVSILFKLAATKTPFDVSGNPVVIELCNQLRKLCPANIIVGTKPGCISFDAPLPPLEWI